MKILYKDNEGVKVITPANWLQRLEDMTDEDYERMVLQVTADKDVPAGINYVFAAENDLLPRETRVAWDIAITETNRSGIGLTKQQFEAKYPNLKGYAVL